MSWMIRYYSGKNGAGRVVAKKIAKTKAGAERTAQRDVNRGTLRGTLGARTETVDIASAKITKHAVPTRKNVPSTAANTMRGNRRKNCGCAAAPRKNHHLRVGQSVVTAEGHTGEVIETIPPDTYRVRLAAGAGQGPREVVVDGSTLKASNPRKKRTNAARKLLGWDKATGIRAQRGVTVWGYHLIGDGRDEYEIERSNVRGAEYFAVSAVRRAHGGMPRWEVLGSFGTLALAKKRAEDDARLTAPRS